jgi:hypothetical protein
MSQIGYIPTRKMIEYHNDSTNSKVKENITLKLEATIIGALLVSAVWLVLPSTLPITLPPLPTAAFATTNDGVTCGGQLATIVGTSRADTLIGTQGDDVIAALAGNDNVQGLGGNDLICGGSGNDQINGGEGNDRINGESGNDELNGGSNLDTDLANGGSGSDTCFAQAETSCEA